MWKHNRTYWKPFHISGLFVLCISHCITQPTVAVFHTDLAADITVLCTRFKFGRLRSPHSWISNTGAFLFLKGVISWRSVNSLRSFSVLLSQSRFSHQLFFCRFSFGCLGFWFPWSVVVLVISASFFTYITLLMVRQTGSKTQTLQTFPRPKKSNYLVPAVLKSQFAAFLSTPPQLCCCCTEQRHRNVSYSSEKELWSVWNLWAGLNAAILIAIS